MELKLPLTVAIVICETWSAAYSMLFGVTEQGNLEAPNAGVVPGSGWNGGTKWTKAKACQSLIASSLRIPSNQENRSLQTGVLFFINRLKI